MYIREVTIKYFDHHVGGTVERTRIKLGFDTKKEFERYRGIKQVKSRRRSRVSYRPDIDCDYDAPKYHTAEMVKVIDAVDEYIRNVRDFRY